MVHILINWWHSWRLRNAIKKGNTNLAKQLLKQRQSGAKLSFTEKLWQKYLQLEDDNRNYRQEIQALQKQLTEVNQKLEALENKQFIDAFEPENILAKNSKFINFVGESFQLMDKDAHKIQVTGIDERIFEPFEAELAEFIQDLLQQYPSSKLHRDLAAAIEDIEGLKRGIDPHYQGDLTPHVYFMKYFLENVYCNYLAWFLIYKSDLLSTKLNILDIAAGPGTVAYGLALFLESSSGFMQLPQLHISYYSLEQQRQLQYRGLQFWRHYIESQPSPSNAFFRFDTTNLFEYYENPTKIPKHFFDFIVISHCFFMDTVSRVKSYQIYRNIFQKSLRERGYVLLIIQGTKLFKLYNSRPSENLAVEKAVIEAFLTDLGLTLEWYKYLNSTGQRNFIPNFGKFVKENLPTQKSMSPLMQKYLGINYNAHYVIDDYVILAKL